MKTMINARNGRGQFYRTSCRVLLSGVCLLAVFSIGPALAQSKTDDASQRFAEITEKGSYQLDLPTRTLSERELHGDAGAPQASDAASKERKPDAERGDFWSWFEGWWGDGDSREDTEKSVATTALWGAIIIVLGFLAAYWLRESFHLFRRKPYTIEPAKTQGTIIPVSGDVSRRPVSDFERYARDGKYGEAVREMLMRCVHVLMQRVGKGNLNSLTNRELMRDADLSESAKSAIAILVATEELSQFGARELNQGTYLKCLAAFECFNIEVKG